MTREDVTSAIVRQLEESLAFYKKRPQFACEPSLSSLRPKNKSLLDAPVISPIWASISSPRSNIVLFKSEMMSGSLALDSYEFVRSEKQSAKGSSMLEGDVFNIVRITKEKQCLTEATRPFYDMVILDVGLLYVLAHFEVLARREVHALDYWLRACGDNVKFMLHLICFLQYERINEPNESFRANSFFTAIFTHYIRNDPEIRVFMAKMVRADFNAIIPAFYKALEEFDPEKMDSLSVFILRCLWIEGKNRFPNTKACYFGISGLIFLRVMSPEVAGSLTLIEDPQKRIQCVLEIKKLSAVFNMESGDEDSPVMSFTHKVIAPKLRAVEQVPLDISEMRRFIDQIPNDGGPIERLPAEPYKEFQSDVQRFLESPSFGGCEDRAFVI